VHGDHFDRIARAELDHDLPVVTTQPAARRLRRWGFGRSLGLETWGRTVLDSPGAGLTITSTPGRHAPGPAQKLLPPVMGSVLELDDGSGPPFRVYVTGDTVFRPWLRDVVDRLGPIDAMVIHLGGTRVLGLLVTMDGPQGADLVELIAPDVTVPVHHDDYTVFHSPVSDFLQQCRDRALPSEIRQVARGGTVPLTTAG
jgi:L-ascorbate metabolism protein UlaG (beta-lactamase superfamily)